VHTGTKLAKTALPRTLTRRPAAFKLQCIRNRHRQASHMVVRHRLLSI